MSDRPRLRLAVGALCAAGLVLAAVAVPRAAGAHPAPQTWVEVLEWEVIGTVNVWHPPVTEIVPVVPPQPIYETEEVCTSTESECTTISRKK